MRAAAPVAEREGGPEYRERIGSSVRPASERQERLELSGWGISRGWEDRPMK